MITEDNLIEKLSDRALRDALSQQKHPTQSMDEAGFTYLDYALFRVKEGRKKRLIVEDINAILKGKDVVYFN